MDNCLAALPRGLRKLRGAYAGPRDFRRVLLSVQAELTPPLIETSLRKLFRVDHRGRARVLIVDMRRSRKDLWLIVNHMSPKYWLRS